MDLKASSGHLLRGKGSESNGTFPRTFDG